MSPSPALAPSLPPSLRLHRALTGALEPLTPAVLRHRLRRGKEDPERLGERLGRAGAPRPAGPLAWLHGASVGEGLSLLPLTRRILDRRPEAHVLLTSTTVTSAAALAPRLPPRALHQFAPVDTPAAAVRFIDHWRPDLAVVVESELWPNLLLAARSAGARTALASARMSAGSARGWRWAPGAARTLLGGFDRVWPQDDEAAARLTALGARDDGRLNLKHLGAAPQADPAALRALQAQLGGRPVLLALSTHPGEDELVLRAYAAALHPGVAPLLVVVPRHPERGAEVQRLLASATLAVTRRSLGQPPPAESGPAAYVADTLGEAGLWLALARICFVGGSLVSGVGGHNPLEPARASVPAVSGPAVDNWGSVYDGLLAAEAVTLVADARTLGDVFAEALADGDRLRAQAQRAAALAARWAADADGALDAVADLLP